MRTLIRNKTKIYYAKYLSKVPVLDEYGNLTGEYDVNYTNPTPLMANTSPAKGKAEAEIFGENLSYDKVIILDNWDPIIDEYSVFWIDKEPYIDENGKTDTPYDYVVIKVAKSLNHTSIALSKVDVSEEDYDSLGEPGPSH